MARKKKEAVAEGMPAWLVTFSDLMTLLLTFFVLLLSMATIDESRKLVVLGSVASAFESSPGKLFNPKSTRNAPTGYAPGAMSPGDASMESLRDVVFDLKDQDVDFRSNKVVSIISIGSEVLFQPGSAVLSNKGKSILNRIYPYVENLQFPMLVAGHSSAAREEEGGNYRVTLGAATADSTWMVSYARSLAVYRHYKELGLDTSRLSMEAFGQYKPVAGNNSAEGRNKNRRVDLVIDTRDAVAAKRIQREREPERLPGSYYFKEFHFDLGLPKQSGQRQP